MFIEELEGAGTPDIERTLRQGFQTWFRNHVSCHLDLLGYIFGLQNLIYVCCIGQILRLRNMNQEEVDDDLFSLACGPDLRVRKYSSCIVNGVRFNTLDRDKHRKTQNSGVMTRGTHNGEKN
jgi:hypothetical protein